MSNIPFEPKDGDYVSLIEKLGKTSIDEIKDEIAKSQKEHLQHAGVLNSPSIEKNISQNNQNHSPAAERNTGTGLNTSQTYTRIENTGTPNFDSLVDKGLKFLLFIGFIFTAAITAFLAVTFETEDEEIVLFPFIVYVIIVAAVSSKLNKRRNSSKEK